VSGDRPMFARLYGCLHVTSADGRRQSVEQHDADLRGVARFREQSDRTETAMSASSTSAVATASVVRTFADATDDNADMTGTTVRESSVMMSAGSSSTRLITSAWCAALRAENRRLSAPVAPPAAIARLSR
jgi:hypothetical protein